MRRSECATTVVHAALASEPSVLATICARFGRAYFWNTYRPETEGQLYHGGGTFNTSSWISLYPRQGLAVFLISPTVAEGAQGALNERANAIADRVRAAAGEPQAGR